MKGTIMPTDFDWASPPLSADDEKLVEGYRRAGRTLDDLPYTVEFEALIRQLGLDDTLASRHDVFKRLLSLRKMGRLPRLNLVVG